MIYVLCSLDHCTVLCCYWYFSKNSYDTYKPTLNDNNFKKTPTKIKTNIITIIVIIIIIIIIIIIMVMVMVSTLFIYLFIYFFWWTVLWYILPCGFSVLCKLYEHHLVFNFQGNLFNAVLITTVFLYLS